VLYQDTNHEQQRELSLTLHRLCSKWAQVRYRIAAAKDVINQLTVHPFFNAHGGTETVETVLRKLGSSFDQQIKRIEEIDDNTKSLINMVYRLYRPLTPLLTLLIQPLRFSAWPCFQIPLHPSKKQRWPMSYRRVCAVSPCSRFFTSLCKYLRYATADSRGSSGY
jgi:hypothetical protein